jgi:CAAX protease family protein
MPRLLRFLLLAFGGTWGAWSAWAHMVTALRWPVFYIGVFAPGIVALWLTWQENGQAGVRSLIGRLFQWQTSVRWYVFALGYIAAIKLIAAFIIRLTSGAWPPFAHVPWLLLFAGAVFSTLVGGQVGEELGWRGYLLPRLAEHIGLRAAGLVVGVVWALWHLPLFYFPGADLAGQSFPIFLLLVTALSVAMTWLYSKTGGSLLLMMLFHAAMNNTTGIVPSASVAPGGPMSFGASAMAWWTLALLWVAAIVFLVLLSDTSIASAR